jgi:CBS domain-containing protein
LDIWVIQEVGMHTLRRVIQQLHLIHADPAATVFDVACLMSEGRVGAIPILEGERLVGVFSERDLMTRVIVAGKDPRTTLVESVMTHEVVTAGLDDKVERCLEKMQGRGCRHLPVVSDGRVISMLSMRDLLRDEIEEQGEEIRHLRAYIQQDLPS